MLLAPHTYLFFPTRTIAQEISRVESSCSLWAASGAGSAAKPKMSKPQIILNAGCAAIAMAIAYRLANLMIDRVLPKKKVEEEEPADEPKAHPALDLLQMCVNGDVDAARLFLICGAEVNRVGKDGATPLFAACKNGHVVAARLLLDYGAEVDRADKDGRTPLYIACQQGHVDAARLLLEKGAAVDRAADNGETPLDVAKRRQHQRVIVLLEESRPLPLGKPRPQRQQSDVQCSICLGPYKERAWTKCNHSFCRKCIMQVCLANYPTNRAPCPFCRQPVLLGELNRRPYEHY